MYAGPTIDSTDRGDDDDPRSLRFMSAEMNRALWSLEKRIESLKVECPVGVPRVEDGLLYLRGKLRCKLSEPKTGFAHVCN
jgi:hypothetical protein